MFRNELHRRNDWSHVIAMHYVSLTPFNEARRKRVSRAGYVCPSKACETVEAHGAGGTKPLDPIARRPSSLLFFAVDQDQIGLGQRCREKNRPE
jgi:hypothetical protein